MTYSFGIYKGVIYEYTRVLLGELPEFSNNFFVRATISPGEIATMVFRAACEIFLHWPPEKVRTDLTMDIIQRMELERPLHYLPFPAELDREKDLWYVAYILYPNRYTYNPDELSEKIYKDVLSGKLYKFPKHYFDGADGRVRACVCLRYMISNYEVFHSVREMYEYFASDAGRHDLDQYKLRLVWRNVFVSPVVFLHEALPPEQRSEFWFRYYSFQYEYRRTLAEEARLKTMQRSIERKNRKTAATN